jgi:hypothetical protein
MLLNLTEDYIPAYESTYTEVDFNVSYDLIVLGMPMREAAKTTGLYNTYTESAQDYDCFAM